MRKRIVVPLVQYEPVKGSEMDRKVGNIRVPPAQYQSLTGVIPPVTIREFRGVNTYDPLSIAPTMFTEMSNFVTDDYPALTVRPGYSFIGGPIGTRVLGVGVWKDTELHAVFNDGTWRRWNGNSWVTVVSGLNTSATCYFTNFQGNLDDINLFMTNGVDQMRRYNGSTVSAVTGAPSGSNFITTYQNRLWVAFGKEIRASALDQPEVWNKFEGLEDDSYGKEMESTRGENVNMLSGGLTKLVIGMPNSIHELYGALPSDFNTRLVTEDVGVSNNNSATTQEGLMRFIHNVGLFEYGGGVMPSKEYSDIVNKYFTLISDDSVLGSDGTKLYFCLSDDNILVYDPRPGIQTWCVWSDIRPTCFAIFQNDLYVGTTNGRVLRVGGTTDGGTPISWHAVTKPFTNGSVAQKSKWVKMYTYWELAAGTTLNISLSPSVDGNDWTAVSTITGTGDKIERIMIPLDGPFALANMVRIKFEGTGWAKMHEITYQYRELPLH